MGQRGGAGARSGATTTGAGLNTKGRYAVPMPNGGQARAIYRKLEASGQLATYAYDRSIAGSSAWRRARTRARAVRTANRKLEADFGSRYCRA